ncbi:hypothetical protein JX265_009126 [Neoarthrinium moseri]|uniref:CRAL-TRIO domain-containing protein n=1 Tax=Neoarthrinium moseri TaxID=1658444 RepID=A0A9Q0AMT6_9PEZI|nr:hypothetical protein JX266_006192 [Neoarthrinium moseri]KAI1862412.1 hypothetical protein JX265_009126 [Neoarthrinium moseri]
MRTASRLILRAPLPSCAAKSTLRASRVHSLGRSPLPLSALPAVAPCRTLLRRNLTTGLNRSRPTLRPTTALTCRNTLQGSSASLLYILPLAIGAFAVYGAASYWNTSTEPSERVHHADLEEPAVEGFDFEAMDTLPGRLGNLTPEQEEKLFELWKLIFQICAVEDEDGGEAVAADEAPAPLQSRTSTAGSEKPKKKRLGLFKKKDKKDKENTPEKAAALDGLKENDPDDKFGHNKVFQETLANRTPASIRDALWTMVKMDHPDQLVLRFLRARKWDVQKALVMLVSTMKWRQDAKVDDDIMLNGEEHFLLQEQQGATEKDKKFAKDFLDQMRLGKSFSYGIDKEGRPTTVVRARLHKAGDQSEESLERYTVYLIETNRMLLSAPVDTGTVIFDMTGFSMANMDYTPVKFMIQCFEANYPESLGVVLVHKAPWVFQGIWKIIRGWLDPVVASKVHFTNNVKDMSEFITPNRIPKELEGDDPWAYEYVEPVVGENPKLKDTATRDKLLGERQVLYDQYEQKTHQWFKEKDAEKRASIKAERNEVAKKLKDGYWILDPYVRSRSLYDRVGILNEGGKLEYHVWNKSAPTNGVAAATASAPAVVETAADDVD